MTVPPDQGFQNIDIFDHDLPRSIVWPSAEQGAACNWKFNDRLLEFCTILARVHLVSLIFSLLREVSKKMVTFSASSWRTESDNFFVNFPKEAENQGD